MAVAEHPEVECLATRRHAHSNDKSQSIAFLASQKGDFLLQVSQHFHSFLLVSSQCENLQ